MYDYDWHSLKHNQTVNASRKKKVLTLQPTLPSPHLQEKSNKTNFTNLPPMITVSHHPTQIATSGGRSFLPRGRLGCGSFRDGKANISLLYPPLNHHHPTNPPTPAPICQEFPTFSRKHAAVATAYIVGHQKHYTANTHYQIRQSTLTNSLTVSGWYSHVIQIIENCTPNQERTLQNAPPCQVTLLAFL